MCFLWVQVVVPGVTLTFRTKTMTRFKSAKSFALIHTTGAITYETPTKEILEIGHVNFEAEDIAGNPVADFLGRRGFPIEDTHALPDGGYSMTPDKDILSSSSTAPQKNQTYAQISGDLNPIHVSPYFAALAELPDTIVHGC